MAKTVVTAQPKTLEQGKDGKKATARKQAHNEAAAQAAGEEVSGLHAAADLPQDDAAKLAQGDVGAISADSLEGDFSFAGVMAEASASMAGSYAGGFAGGSAAFAQDAGGYDAGSGVGGGTGGSGPSMVVVGLGALAVAGGIVAAVSSSDSDDTPAAPPPPPPPPANTAPTVAATQTVAATEDEAATITVAATDTAGDTLTYTASAAANGTVTGGQNGVFTYTPNANYNGTDTFTVTVRDQGGLTTTQTVTVNIAAVNDAPTVSVAEQELNTDEDEAVTGTVVADDVDGDTLTYAVGTAAANGTVTIDEDGAFTYTPNANYSGTDTFTVVVTDEEGLTATQTVTVNVAPVNDAPTVSEAEQNLTVDENDVLTGTVVAEDVDGDTLTYTVETEAENGVVTIDEDGVFTYTPNADFDGDDSFVITVDDGNGGTVSQTINVTVNNVGPQTEAINIVDAGSNVDADDVDTTYTVTLGNYNYTISGFDVGDTPDGGDRIIGPAGVNPSIDNVDTTDGILVLSYAANGQVATITLTDLAPELDASVFGPNSFNAVFGSGAIA